MVGRELESCVMMCYQSRELNGFNLLSRQKDFMSTRRVKIQLSVSQKSPEIFCHQSRELELGRHIIVRSESQEILC